MNLFHVSRVRVGVSHIVRGVPGIDDVNVHDADRYRDFARTLTMFEVKVEAAR
jgi:hypothetical protein